ncbi:hypothetical protein B0J14DRAFT_705032 [Halenospora varia]|nr:hypothetical protein B0J14DRAFT_705032 [Halenospora varia]
MIAELGKAVVAVCIVFPVIAALAIAARFQARRIKGNSITVDDYLLVLSWCVSTGMAIMYIFGAYNGGIGTSFKEMDMHQITVFTSILFAGQFLYLFSVSLIKISIVCFYKRIFQARTFIRILNGVLVTIVLWTVAFFFATLFQAWPISHAWTGAGKNLIDYPAMYLALGATDLALDIIILCLPMPMIRSLKMKSRRKFVVAAILSLGFLCIIASAVRINYLRLVNYGLEETVSWGTVQYIIWSQIEACWSVVCACLPTLGPIFHGGRTAESMVNSFRSIFSSQSSESLREKSRKNSSNSERSAPKSTNNTTEVYSTGKTQAHFPG